MVYYYPTLCECYHLCNYPQGCPEGSGNGGGGGGGGGGGDNWGIFFWAPPRALGHAASKLKYESAEYYKHYNVHALVSTNVFNIQNILTAWQTSVNVRVLIGWLQVQGCPSPVMDFVFFLLLFKHT